MENRVLMAKFDPKWVIIPGTGHCACGSEFHDREVIALYPNPDYDEDGIRDIVCMTCHFWFVHDVLEELGR